MTYTDWLGQPIEVGSPVLYAVSNSHYAEVVWGEVLQIIPVEPRRRDVYDMTAERDPVTRRLPVIGEEDYWDFGRKFKLKIQPYYQNSDFRELNHISWNARGIEYTLPSQRDGIGDVFKRALPKPVTIQNVEKVTVFPLPEGARERLETYLDEAVRIGNERLR